MKLFRSSTFEILICFSQGGRTCQFQATWAPHEDKEGWPEAQWGETRCQELRLGASLTPASDGMTACLEVVVLGVGRRSPAGVETEMADGAQAREDPSLARCAAAQAGRNLAWEEEIGGDRGLEQLPRT